MQNVSNHQFSNLYIMSWRTWYQVKQSWTCVFIEFFYPYSMADFESSSVNCYT